jgi:hypothetical protein
MPLIIGNIQENYAIYYNSLNNRSGPVFDAPFKSKLIMNTDHFFTVLSYILNNPVNAGIINNFNNYHWSSKINIETNHNIVDSLYIQKTFSENYAISLQEYIFSNSEKNKLCDFEVYRINDNEACDLFEQIMIQITGTRIYNRYSISANENNTIVSEAIYKGLSVRQIKKFTNLPEKYIRNTKINKPYL